MCRPCTPRPPASATRSLAGSQIAKTAWAELHQPRRTARTSSADHGRPLRATGASQPTDGAHRCGAVRGPRHAGARQLPSQDSLWLNCQSRFCRIRCPLAAAWAAGRSSSPSAEASGTTPAQSTAEEEVQERDKWAMLSLNSVLLSATHPPFCSVSRCLSGVPEAETRGAPLPLTAAAASLLPASRRVPGPVAGLHHTPPLLLPPTTCGLSTPFSTSFPPRRSRSVMGELAWLDRRVRVNLRCPGRRDDLI